LGVGLQYEYSPSRIAYSAPYLEMGKKLWTAFKYELFDLLCNGEKNEPKEWLKDTVTGDIRNLATGIISVITAKYNVSIAIALPATALVIKNGLLNYCSTPPEKPKETVSKILKSKKLALKRIQAKNKSAEKLNAKSKTSTAKSRKNKSS
jgi:hypothetical protein